MTPNPNRQPKGVSTGGQFAPGQKGEASVTLGGAASHAQPSAPAGQNITALSDPAFTGAMSTLNDANHIKAFTDGVRSAYPEAVAFRAEDYGDSYDLELRFADGSTSVDREDDELDDFLADAEFYGGDSALYLGNRGQDEWLELDKADDLHAEAVTAVNQAAAATLERYAQDNGKKVVDSGDLSAFNSIVDVEIDDLNERLRDENEEHSWEDHREALADLQTARKRVYGY